MNIKKALLIISVFSFAAIGPANAATIPTVPTVISLKGTGKCIAIQNDSPQAGVAAVQIACNTSASDKFLIISAGTGVYFLQNQSTGHCLDIMNASGADGAGVNQYPCGGGNNQRFMIREAATTGSFELVASHSLKCITAQSGSGSLLEQSTCNQSSLQHWVLGSAAPVATPTATPSAPPVSSARISSVRSGKCLDIKNKSTANLAAVIQQNCGSSLSQQFTLRPRGTPGEYEIFNQLSKKCLDVNNASTADGATLIQYACSGGGNQRFKVAAGNAAGDLVLKAVHSGKCLDVKNASTLAGAVIHQWTCNGQNNQFWKTALVAAPSPTPVPTTTPAITPSPTPRSTPTASPSASPTVTPSATPPTPVLETNEPSSYSPPINITRGGTYSGNWASPDSDTIAVNVNAGNEAVIIENCHVAGPGRLIVASGSNLTVRNCFFHGKPPTRNGAERPKGVVGLGFKNLVVEHNYFDHVSKAVAVDFYSGDGSVNQTLKIRFNRVRNIDGRLKEGGAYFANFASVQNFHGPGGNPRGGEIAWNDVQNEPFQSASEDLINFYSAGGRVDSWFKVHDNLLRGSYAVDPATQNSSGSGMIVDGDQTPDSNAKTAYIESFNNTVISTTNAGMNISAGHDISYHHNRIISSGRLPDGRCMPGNYAGVAVWNTSSPGSGINQSMESNIIGWGKCGYTNPYTDRNDVSTNEKGSIRNNTFLPDAPITYQTELNEVNAFLQRAQAQGIVFGPIR